MFQMFQKVSIKIHCKFYSFRFSSSSFSLNNFNNFNNLIAHGKSLARKSLVIEDCTRNLNNLWFQNDHHLNGKLFDSGAKRISRWRVGSNGSFQGGKQCKRFLLIEFNTDSDLKNAIKYLQHKYNPAIFSQHCLLRDENFPKQTSNTNVSKMKIFVQNNPINGMKRYRLMSSNGENLIGTFDDYPNENKIKYKNNNQNQQDKLKIIKKLLKGDDLIPALQHQIRFFICHQIEEHLQNSSSDIFKSSPLSKGKNKNRNRNNHPNLMDSFELIPFGSDITGFGNENSDIDFCFAVKNLNSNANNRKKKIRTDRSIRILNSVSITMECSIIYQNFYLRNFQNIQRIFKAFVPIIKCRSRLLPLINIDLSVDTEFNSGIQMAEYLYHCAYQCPDSEQIRAFILLLKFWAKQHEIIHSNPGDWFSSFQLTILAIAFLQHRRLIPTINEWINCKQKTIDTTTIDQQQQNINTEIESQVSELIENFFNYVITYDFWNFAMDIKTGQMDLPKPTLKSSACFILNPFIETLNITKTVSELELERFLSFCKQSLELMKRQDFKLIDLFGLIDDRLQYISNF